MGAAWKTIPSFISSAFRDLHAERDQLNNVVFPALAERLRGRRCRLEPIDLRVGVETDSTKTERERELQILKVCLAEIERSRPFLLVLLGDRYGWVPGEDRIAAASGEAGFAPEDKGVSVTALEIEYGLLKMDPVQRRHPQEVATLCFAPQRRAFLRGMVRLGRRSHARREIGHERSSTPSSPNQGISFVRPRR